MPTLYRQYRPKRFADVAGQPHITSALINAVNTGKLSHAYLFYGPRGTGKTTTARILAKTVNCAEPNQGEACGTCVTCQTTTNIDILEIDAASNRGIDDIRALQEGVALRPTSGSYKIYIIDEVHMLTREAFTALLKTLEEPVSHAIFILATTEFHKVPETIVSRCQVYRFRRASHDELSGRLHYLLQQEKREADPAALDFIIERCDGCFRDAESMLGQALTSSDTTIRRDDLVNLLGLPTPELVTRFLTALVGNNAADAIATADQIITQGFDPDQFLQETIRQARRAALDLVQAKPAAASWGPTALSKLPTIIRALLQATQDMAYVPEPLIAIHLAILTVCTFSAPPSAATPLSEKQQGNNSQTTKASPPTPTPAIRAETISPTVTPDNSTLSLETMSTAWPQLISALKQSNPVAATFLRAMNPTSIDGNLVKIEARYMLHRNFFEKSANRQLIETELTKLLNTPVRATCYLQERTTQPQNAREREQQESDLVAAVKDVFGSAPS